MMATGAKRELWWHTATLQATVLNSLRAKGKWISPRELHPYLEKKPLPRVGGKGLEILRDVFCKQENKTGGG